MSYDNKKFLDANGVTQIVGLLDDYATNETLSTVVNSVQSALDQKVDDVQIDGTSILNNGAANIPVAGPNQLGVLKVGSGTRGVNVSSTTDELQINFATAVLIKSGVNTYCPITPKYVDAAAFYGLASAAGKSMSSVSGATVGVYPDEQKQAIQKMLGLDGILGDFENSAVASKAYAIGETFVYNGKRYRATADIAQNYVITPGTNCELAPIDGHYVRDTDYPSNSTIPGVVKVNKDGAYGLRVSSEIAGDLRIMKADDANIKSGTPQYKPIVPYTQHQSVFFGLSKAAGVDLANETVTVGTYPAASKTAIRSLIGAISKDDIAGSNGENRGVAFFNGNYGVGLNSETGGVYVSRPGDDVVKAGVNDYKPIVPSIQHKSVFYALSKLAGVDLASNASDVIGVYPQNAKTAIQTMLGIEADIPLVETVTGTTVSITGMPNVRYICGTCSLLTITPPASGSIVVRFTSGSTPTVLTVPNTVKFPVWFDYTSLEADTVYEIIITDGVYGGVMSWAT